MSPALPYNFSISENDTSYFIEIRMESSSPSQDKQIAGLRSKAQLGYYLEKNSNQVVMELKHFYMQSQERRNNESIYRFKVDKENIKVVKSR